MTDWSHAKICVEKHIQEELKIDHLCKNCNSKDHAEVLRSAYYKQKIWPLNNKHGSPRVLTISFLDKGDNVEWTPLHMLEGYDKNGNAILPDPLNKELFKQVSPQELVKTVVKKRIEPIIGLKFKFIDSHGIIRISFDSRKGSWSLIGSDCAKEKNPKPTMNLGWLDVGTITHEFLHILGAIHEHQNPRGIDIEWNKQNLFEWGKETQGWDKEVVRQNIIDRYSINQINGSKYDPYSIMLYFYPNDLTKDGKGTRQNVRLSPTDVIWMSKMYPGGEKSPTEFYENAYGNSIEDTLLMQQNIHGKGMNAFALSGIIIGSVVAIFTLISIVLYIYRKRRRH